MWSFSWLFVLEAVVIVTENVLIIVIFRSTPRLRKRKYSLIVSLSVADLLVGLVSIPVHLTFQAASKITQLHHIIYLIQDSFFGTASLFGLTVLAIERACATYFPLKHRCANNIPYIAGIAVTWVPSLVIAVSSYFTNTYTLMKGVSIAMALVVMIAAYFLIFFHINCKGTVPSHAIHRHNKKLTTTLAIITVISLATWLPYQITAVYVTVYYYPTTLTFYWLRNAAKFLHYSNSLANFVVYALRMREFKREILRRIRCCASNQIFPDGGIELENIGRNRDNGYTIGTTESSGQGLSNYRG